MADKREKKRAAKARVADLFVDPRRGDIEDDASSTKRRSMLSLFGSMLVEISLPKLHRGLGAAARGARPPSRPRADRLRRVAHRGHRQARLPGDRTLVAADPRRPHRAWLVRLARALPHGREEFLGAEFRRRRAELCRLPRSLPAIGRAAVRAQRQRRAKSKTARGVGCHRRDSRLRPRPARALAGLAAYASLRQPLGDRILEEGRRGGARQQRRRDHRLSGGGRAGLGLRRCRHGATAQSRQIRQGAEARPDLAHRPSVRHSCRRRTLWQAHRERPLRSFRQ